MLKIRRDIRTRTIRQMVLIGCCLTTPLYAQSPRPADATAAATAGRQLTLEDLFSELSVVDGALSPSGRHLALIVRRADDDLLLTYDLTTGDKKYIQRAAVDQAGKTFTMRMGAVYWKTDDRILYRTHVRAVEGKDLTSMTPGIGKFGDRLFAVNRDGSNLVRLLADTRDPALEGVFYMGDIASFLIHDPGHILLQLSGLNGRSLFKVDLETGKGERVEPPSHSVAGWWLDLEGRPVVRMTFSSGTIRLHRKQDDKWVQFMKFRIREMRERPDYESVGPSDQPGKYYVLARPPGRDRIGLYLYDLEKEQFGEAIVENAGYDITSARVSRDGKRILYHCYTTDVRICEFSDRQLEGHMRGLRRFFEETANVYVYDSSQDSKTLLLYVEGPRDPPAYYYYRVDAKRIEQVGSERTKLNGVSRPGVSVVRYAARDGIAITGYLTTPGNAPKGTKLPLIVYPHGGPELRDHLTFDPWVQYFASRGYAVFQPNFRGSDGYGKAFAESGYGEWGRKMQDDITDGMKHLVTEGLADPARACIVGASYGGYAALAGAALTPDLFKCAVSVSGISDLDDFIGWRKRNWGRDSDGYTYWLKSIGDPDEDEQRLREVSPLQLADRIKIPILLVHGTEDEIVPIAQSRAMKKALDKSGRRTRLVELAQEGHSYWSNENEMLAMSSVDAFLWEHLGPGYGSTSPPVARDVKKK